MGQKVNPVGLRIGIIRDWESKWFSEKDFAKYLHEDIKIRKYLETKLKDAVVSKILIQRAKGTVEVDVYVLKPGMVIGQDGKNIEELKKQLKKINPENNVKININEIKNPELDATIIAKDMAKQLENRASFRIVQKKTIQRVMKAGAKGVKTEISGRLAGADIARSEGYAQGIVPLHTLRADIDYAVAEAHTTFGRLGCTVWICRGEILPVKKNRKVETETKGE